MRLKRQPKIARERERGKGKRIRKDRERGKKVKRKERRKDRFSEKSRPWKLISTLRCYIYLSREDAHFTT